MGTTKFSIIFKRPLAAFCLSLITGIMASSLTGSPFFITGMLLLLAAILYAAGGRFRGRLYISIGIIIFYALGAFEYLILDGINTGRFESFGDMTVTVTGIVDSEPDIKDSRVSYVLKVSELKTQTGEKADRGKLLLSMPKTNGMIFYEYGSELTFTGQLTLPKGVRNPGGFDYRRYLAQKGVSASVFVTADAVENGDRGSASPFIKAGQAIKKRIVRVIDKSLPRQQAGLLNGMLIGYREGLSQEVADAFSDAGLTHIMAVSGANIVFLIIPLNFLFKRLRLGKKASGLLTIAFLLIFIFITGFQPSVLRAVVMASVVLVAGMLNRETDFYTTIAFAAMLLLISSPYMLFDAGFLLSFAATLSIVLFYGNIKKLLERIKIPSFMAGVLSATMAAQLGVLPITLAYFNKFSLVSLLSNLLAVPLLEFITILGMLMAVLGQISIVFSQVLGYANCVLLSAVLYITRISSSLPFATIRTVTPPVPFIILYYAALWFMLWYRPLKNIRIRRRYVAAALGVSMLALVIKLLVPGELTVVFLDVGQGDSALIRTCTGKNILLDGGGSSNPEVMSKVGETVVVPFLLDEGVTSLDAVIASHGHTDHTQGLVTAMEQFRVKRLIIPATEDGEGFEKLLEIARSKHVEVSRCDMGDVIRLDDKTGFDVLGPPPGLETAGMDKTAKTGETPLNNTSLVLKLHYGEADILFTGDAETEEEQALLDSGEDLAAEVVKIGHHGSSTSSGREFIEKIGPKSAVISVGKNNFGHPSPLTVSLLESEGIRVFRTDECGAVVLTSRGKDIRMRRTVEP